MQPFLPALLALGTPLVLGAPPVHAGIRLDEPPETASNSSRAPAESKPIDSCFAYDHHFRWLGGGGPVLDGVEYYNGIASDGSRLALSGGRAQFTEVRIVDIGSPQSPRLLGRMPWVGVRGVAFHAGYLYVLGVHSSFGSVLQVVDVTDPADPQVLHNASMSGTRLLTVDTDLAYLYGEAFGFSAVDLSEPSRPVLSGTPVPGALNQAIAAPPFVYGAGRWDGVAVIDVSAPTTPVLVRHVPLPGYCGAVARVGTALIASVSQAGTPRYRLITLDTTDPATPLVVNSLATPYEVTDLAVRGGRLFAAERENGLRIYDVLPDGALQLVRAESTPLPASMVHFTESRLVVVERFFDSKEPSLASVEIFSADPSFATARAAGRVATPGLAYDLEVADDRLYLADATDLSIFDVASARKPRLLGRLDLASRTTDLALSGTTVFAGLRTPAGTGGVYTIDASSPANPRMENLFALPFPVRRIALGPPGDGGDPDYAYVAGGSSGMEVLDIHDPTAPVRVFNLPATWGYYDLTVRDELLYIASEREGLLVASLTDPAAPAVIGVLDERRRAYALDLSGTTACLGGWDVALVDISDPTAPRVITDVLVRGEFAGCVYDGDRLYAPMGTEGVLFADAPGTAGAPWGGEFRPGALILDVAVHDGVIYTAAYDQGVLIMPTPCGEPPATRARSMTRAASAVRLRSVVTPLPNPFSSVIAFRISEEAPPARHLDIHDVAGRLVTRLSRDPSSGTEIVTWDGRSFNGTRVAPGVYFARLAQGDSPPVTCKVVFRPR